MWKIDMRVNEVSVPTHFRDEDFISSEELERLREERRERHQKGIAFLNGLTGVLGFATGVIAVAKWLGL